MSACGNYDTNTALIFGPSPTTSKWCKSAWIKSPNPAIVYKEDWRQSLVEASAEESAFRLSLWEDFKNQGSVVELATINGLVGPEDGLEFPLILTTARPIDDVLDHELVMTASGPELSGLSHASVGRVPVLIIAPTVEPDHVEVRLGWVLRAIRNFGLALVSLSEDAPEGTDKDIEEETAVASSRAERFESRKARPNQARFKFRVFERYGAQCAVCAVNHPLVLEAAHIRPWIEQGSDHPGNGLLLCALHHRAYDAGLWAIEPDTLEVMPWHTGPALNELLISRKSLAHLPVRPMGEALQYAWARRWTPGRREGDVISTSSSSRSRFQ